MSSKLQQDIVVLLKNHLCQQTYSAIAKESGCSGRILSYWSKGERIPRDIEVIERVLIALGYTLVIQKIEE